MTASSAKSKAYLHQQLEQMTASPAGDETYLLFLDDKSYGPFHTAQVRELIQLNEDELSADNNSIETELMIQKYGENEAMPFYEHLPFQRRKPQLLSQTDLKAESAENFYCLKNGQQLGPFSVDEIEEKLQSYEIIPTDLLSNDSGVTWFKLYQYAEFERRNSDSQELPSAPAGNVFVESHRQTKHKLTTPQREVLETEAITGLAYLGNLRAGKGIEVQKVKNRGDLTDPERKIETEEQSFQYFWYGLFFISLTGILLVFLTWSSPTPSNKQMTKTAPEMSAEQVPTLKGQAIPAPELKKAAAESRPSRPQVSRAAPVVKQVARTRRADRTSFTESEAYKRAEASVGSDNEDFADAEQAEYYYDDGSAPIENDPVRRQASRELLNPNSEYDDWATAVIRAPASEDGIQEEDDMLDLFDE